MSGHESTSLIPFAPHQIGSQTVNAVNARDLHTFLQIKQRFNDWIIQRIKQYGFVQDIDFTRYTGESPGNPNPPIEYALTEHAADMLERAERKRPIAQSRFVYAIRHGNTHYIKVGRAHKSHIRLESLQVGNPIPLSFFGLWEVEDARRVERFLHTLFKGSRTLGEWFFLSEQQERTLLDVMQDYKRIA